MVIHIHHPQNKNNNIYIFPVVVTLPPHPPLLLRLLVFLLLVLLRLLPFLDLYDFLFFLEDKKEKSLNDFII
jgi:hypothetical protein